MFLVLVDDHCGVHPISVSAARDMFADMRAALKQLPPDRRPVSFSCDREAWEAMDARVRGHPHRLRPLTPDEAAGRAPCCSFDEVEIIILDTDEALAA